MKAKAGYYSAIDCATSSWAEPRCDITVAITPIMMLLLFVYVLGGAIEAGTDNYVNYLYRDIADGNRIRRRIHSRAAVYRCEERAYGTFHNHANQAIVGIVGSRINLACFRCPYYLNRYPRRRSMGFSSNGESLLGSL